MSRWKNAQRMGIGGGGVWELGTQGSGEWAFACAWDALRPSRHARWAVISCPARHALAADCCRRLACGGCRPLHPCLGDFLKEIPQTPKNFFGASRALNTPCPKSPSSSQASRTPGRHPRYAPAQTAYNATSPRRPSSASPHTHGRRTTSNGRIPSSPPQPA